MADRPEPRWVDRLVVEAVQLDLMREHGGLRGSPDEPKLEAALAQPHQLCAYGQPTIAALTAAYGFGIVRTHPFPDGNKRVGFVVMAVFAGLNGYDVVAAEEEVVAIMLLLAGGRLTEEELAAWVESRLEPRKA